MKLHWELGPKQILLKTISFSLYVGCLAFVINRGFICFKKYLSKPEGIEISYAKSGDVRFPSFTFCPNHQRVEGPSMFNNEISKKCNIGYNDFHIIGKYVGSGDPDCLDPKYLQRNIGASILDLSIMEVKMTTYDGLLDDLHVIDVENDTYFEWSHSYLDYYQGGCHTLDMKPAVLKHGLRYVRPFYSSSAWYGTF